MRTEGYSNTFNYGIKKCLRQKSSKGLTLQLVELDPQLLAVLLFEGESLISSKCFNIPRGTSSAKLVRKNALSAYNLYKAFLIKGFLHTLDESELL